MMLLRQFALILVFITTVSGVSFGQTLFDHSLAAFDKKVLQAAPDDYCFVVLGDSRDGDAMFRKVLKAAQNYQPLFILHGGDYSASGTERETAAFLSLVKETIPETPIFVVQGNHENRTVFARDIGPAYFTLRSKRLGFTVVAVDNSDYKLKPADLDYISREISSAARTKFVAMHIPPKTESWSWHTFTQGAEELQELLLKKPVDGIFFSHVHLYDRAQFGGVPAFITGGAGAPLLPFGFPGDPVYHFLLVQVKKGKATFSKIVVAEKR